MLSKYIFAQNIPEGHAKSTNIDNKSGGTPDAVKQVVTSFLQYARGKYQASYPTLNFSRTLHFSLSSQKG